MKSRVHRKFKTKYRVGNWPAYDDSLVRRGDITLWLSDDALAAWRPTPSGRPGGPRTFSNPAIETALTLRLVVRLPLRQTEGFLRSIFTILQADLEVPDHTTLSRRSQQLDRALDHRPRSGPLHLVVDSTGVSAFGEGEWAAAKHGGCGKRGWKKLHLGVDRAGSRTRKQGFPGEDRRRLGSRRFSRAKADASSTGVPGTRCLPALTTAAQRERR